MPCFLTGSYLGHPCFVNFDPRNVTATSDGTACGTVALHDRVNVEEILQPVHVAMGIFLQALQLHPSTCPTCLDSFLSLLFTSVAQHIPDL